LEIFPYCPKYSWVRKVGMSCYTVNRCGYAEGSETHLFLSKPLPYTDDIHHIALHDAYVSKLTPAQGVQVLAFALFLFLLLHETLMTTITSEEGVSKVFYLVS
jgi:hypothetical protein